MNQVITVSCVLCLSFCPALFAIETSEAVKVTPVLKTSQSWDGALLKYPQGQAEITGVRIEIAPGGETGWHLHSAPSFGVVLQGQLEIKLKNGKKNVVKAGDALAEVVNTAHSGKNIGTEPVLLAHGELSHPDEGGLPSAVLRALALIEAPLHQVLDALPAQPGRQQHRGRDHGDIEQHRRGRRHRKAVEGVEDAGTQGHERHEADVGKHPAGHDHGRIESPTVLKARGHGPHEHGRAHHAHHAHHQQGPKQHRAHRIDQGVGGRVALSGAGFSQDGHEGLRERPFGKQAAQQVGDAKSHLEGVGGGAGPEGRGHQQLAHEPGDAGRQREQRNEGGGFEQ